MIYLDIFILVILILISWQDFRYRAISWIFIPVLAALFILYALLSLDYTSVFTNFLSNAGFLCIQYLILTIYFSLKYKKITNIINKSIGIGDILFFIVLCFYFSPINFIIFSTISLLLITLFFGVWQLVRKSRNMQIPLAGALSIFLFVMIIGKDFLYSFSLYDDFYVTQFLQLLYV